ncbi:FAD-dependent oxidoreductase [Xanthobacter sp. KR7-65]|uniref:FAD-dependent oxidoreductase n=1 Tax=Xanthobacter sp. KR7-65 TaxID=3156612 RepID=UPI0032B368EE
MAWRKVAAFEALRDGGVTGVEVDNTPIALFRMGDEVRATHGICTHALAFLKDGYVENGTIECPLHQGVFDIRTGQALCAPLTRDLQTFAAKVEGGAVYVDLKIDSTQPDSGAVAETASAAPAPAAPETADAPAQLPLVIAGAGQAAAAAIRAARAAGFAAPIHLVGAEPHLPYERPPLSKDALSETFDPASATCFSMQDAATLGVSLHLSTRVTGVDGAARRVTLSDGTALDYGALLIATGGAARRLGVPGADLPGVHHLRTHEDARAIAAALQGAKRVAVVGGGFIGLELASAARARGAEVVVLERESELMARLLPPALGAAFRTLATANGVDIRRDVAVEAIAARDGALVLATTQGEITADTVLVGVGLIPETGLAELAGCAVEGGIVVNAAGRTSVPGIWAAGDCALHHAPLNGRRGRLESWQNAEEQGAAAGRSIAGDETARADKAPWFWTDQFGLNIQMAGVPGLADQVAVSGPAAAEGALYRTLDDAGRVTAVVAFSDAAALRAGRAEIGTIFDLEAAGARLVAPGEPHDATSEEEDDMSADPAAQFAKTYVWPKEGLSIIPDWVYTDETIYRREVEKIFHGRTWNYVALECEIENPGDFIRSNVGPTPVVVARAEDGSINVFENRCAHRAAEFCRDLSGNAKEFVCPYHQWSYDLKGNLVGVPFRRGVDGKGGMPKDFKSADHGLKQLNVTTHRGVVFASYADDMEPLADYLGDEVLREFEATFDGRKLTLLGHYRHSLPGNWKLYHENLKDPYHATLLHTFLVTFGLLVAGNKSLMLADPTGRHGVMASAKSDAVVSEDKKKEMRAYKEGMTLEEPRFMDFIDEFDSPWSVTMATIWPNLIVQREMNTLGIRHIVPNGPNEFIMKWTMFGFEGDDAEMTRHRLRQGNLMGPAGFLGLEDNEAIKFVQDGMLGIPGGEHLVKLDPDTEAGTADTLISEAAIRAMYRHWRDVMGIA